ncbi:hypothetical protein N9544_06520 [Flavobacteriales bacterium]|nr:hypothetical protein [Flavobacteriales bacterium]
MKIPNPMPFHEIPLSSLANNITSTPINGSISNSNTKLIGTLLVSFAILAAGGYIFYEMHQINKKRSEKLT